MPNKRDSRGTDNSESTVPQTSPHVAIPTHVVSFVSKNSL